MSDSADSFHALGDDHEESVRIAVSALGDMRNATPSHPSPSSPHSSVSVSPSSPSLVTRVSHLPLVNSVLRTYEQGKASSRVVKYGAEMMESSVRSISRPVIDRLPVNVNQLDEFACRQLDRFDRYRRSNVTSPSAEDSPESRPKLRTKTLDGSLEEDSIDRPSTSTHEWHSGETDSPRIPRWIESTNAYGSPHLPPPPDSRSSTPTQVGEDSPNGKLLVHPHATSPGSQDTERRVAQRSRWQAVLLEAGGLSAALSDENMRRLKYCLHCLQYATAQIDAQILILRDFIASLHPLPPASSSLRGSDPPSPSSSRRPVSQAHMRTLTDVRRDLVQTIRQVVDVVSKYAGGALPEPARTRVRGFILKLPQRWASKAGVNVPSSGLTVNGGPEAVGSSEREKDRERERDSVTAAASGSAATRRPNRRAQYRERGPGSDSRTSSRAPSPTSPRVPRNVYGGASSYVVDGLQPNSNGDDGRPGDQPVSTGAAVVAAQRILTLATESLDMMRGVTGVMRDSLDRADAWVNRLRTVGIQRNGGIVDAIPEEEVPQQSSSSPLSSPRTQKRWHHRRGSSTYSATSAGEDDIESYYSYRSEYQPGLASPAMSAAGSGTSTAYSSTYNVSGAGLTSGSGPSTPGVGYMAPTGAPGGQGPQSPASVLPIAPLGRMSLAQPPEGGKVNGADELGLHDVEGMDVDDDG